MWELADQAEAILEEWQKYGRCKFSLYEGDKSCLAGAYIRTQNDSTIYDDIFDNPFFQSLNTFLSYAHHAKNLVDWNDYNNDETVFRALTDFAKYQRSLDDSYHG